MEDFSDEFLQEKMAHINTITNWKGFRVTEYFANLSCTVFTIFWEFTEKNEISE